MVKFVKYIRVKKSKFYVCNWSMGKVSIVVLNVNEILTSLRSSGWQICGLCLCRYIKSIKVKAKVWKQSPTLCHSEELATWESLTTISFLIILQTTNLKENEILTSLHSSGWQIWRLCLCIISYFNYYKNYNYLKSKK